MTAQPASSGSPLEPVVRDAVQSDGFELEAMDISSAGRKQLVRVIVDAEDGVGLDDIATVSRTVSAALDRHEHLIVGPYTLEVTSPGLDRPLTHPRHWRRNHLRLVRVRLTDGTEFVGRVGDCAGDAVTMLVAGQLRDLRLADVARAVVEVEFRQPPAAELAALAGRSSADGAEEDR